MKKLNFKLRNLVFLMVFIMTSLCALAQAIVDQGSCGNSLTWVLTNDSTLTIYGSDTMPDYYDWSGGTPWDAYKNDIATVIIGDSVTTIGRGAFKDCINLTAVTIPISVTSIGASAFHQCVKLTSVTIPDSVISIGNNAFQDCMSISSVIIGNNVKIIGMWAFALCKSLTSVTIPNSVTSIGGSAFIWCYDLERVTLSNSLTTIEDAIFCWCTSLISITIPNSVTTIKGQVFSSCTTLTSVTIGNNVSFIDYGSFSYCSGLRSITIHAITPPIIYLNVFRDVPDTLLVYIPCGTYDDYRTTSGWNYFSNFIEPTTDTSFYAANFLQGETYSDSNFINLTKEGRYCITLQNDNGCDSVVCLDLVYDNTGVVPITNCELQVTSYEIFDVFGRKAPLSPPERGKFPSFGGVRGGEITIDVSHLPSGMYFIRMQTDRGIIVKKIIK